MTPYTTFFTYDPKPFVSKLLSLKALFWAFIIGYFYPVTGLYAVMVSVICADFLTGILASYYTGGWSVIESRRAWKTVWKLAIVLVILMCLVLLEKHFLPTLPYQLPVVLDRALDALRPTVLFSGVVIFSEIISIDENYEKIWGYRPLGMIVEKFKVFVNGGKTKN